MEKDPFKEYLRESEPDKARKGYVWSTAIGLQAVDGLKPSQYLIDTAIQNIEGKITIKEAQKLIENYYEERQAHLSDDERTEEADKVSSRIAEILSETAFSFSPNEYIFIHHLAVFVSRLWQIHIFGEDNTRTTAVFFIKYLRTLGFTATNDIFAENAWYFRNALVRANYNNLQQGIHETTEYLEMFLKNLLLNEKNELHSRNLHISGLWEMGKVDIDKRFAEKVNDFSVKTVVHIHRMFERLGFEEVFGRSAVMELLELKGSGTSKLLSNLLQADIIEPVSGFGKGKYRFKK